MFIWLGNFALCVDNINELDPQNTNLVHIIRFVLITSYYYKRNSSSLTKNTYSQAASVPLAATSTNH